MKNIPAFTKFSPRSAIFDFFNVNQRTKGFQVECVLGGLAFVSLILFCFSTSYGLESKSFLKNNDHAMTPSKLNKD